MKDYLGQELQVGDYIIQSFTGYNRLHTARIKKITNSQITSVEVNEAGDELRWKMIRPGDNCLYHPTRNSRETLDKLKKKFDDHLASMSDKDIAAEFDAIATRESGRINHATDKNGVKLKKGDVIKSNFGTTLLVDYDDFIKEYHSVDFTEWVYVSESEIRTKYEIIGHTDTYDGEFITEYEVFKRRRDGAKRENKFFTKLKNKFR